MSDERPDGPRLENPVRTFEVRMTVLNLLRHQSWCGWKTTRECYCKAGRAMMALIEAEREDERLTTKPRPTGRQPSGPMGQDGSQATDNRDQTG